MDNPGRVYLKAFVLAIIAEFVALLSLLPGLAMIGMRHSATAPKGNIVVVSEWLGFILHLPTILLTWPFRNSSLPIIFLTPAGQIILFTFLFAYILGRKSDLLRQSYRIQP